MRPFSPFNALQIGADAGAAGGGGGGSPTGVSARYIEITMLNCVDQSYIAELDLLDASDVSQISGATVSASSGTAANAVDGNTGTLWQCSNRLATNGVFKFDAGAGNTIDAEKLSVTISGFASFSPDQIRVRTSDDDVTYTAHCYLHYDFSASETKVFSLLAPSYTGSHHAFGFSWYVNSGNANFVSRWEEMKILASSTDIVSGLTPLGPADGSGRANLTDGTTADWASRNGCEAGFFFYDWGTPTAADEIAFTANADADAGEEGHIIFSDDGELFGVGTAWAKATWTASEELSVSF